MANEIKTNKDIFFFENLIDDYVDYHDDENIIEVVNDLIKLTRELRYSLKKCEEIVIDKIVELQVNLIENGNCPECGGELENISDERRETYVPYGDTSVPLGTGYRTVCSRCGYEVED